MNQEFSPRHQRKRGLDRELTPIQPRARSLSGSAERGGLNRRGGRRPLAGAAEGNRSMRFTVKDSIKDVCLAFTFASYSPIAASGKMTLKNVSLKKNESAVYEFDDLENINVLDKKNVKAMRLVLVVNQRGETGVDSLVVPVPSNGPRD
jgi:hypothetical protein